MIITQTFTTARWQIVVKKSEATKQKTKQKTKTKQYKTQKREGAILSYRFYFTDFLERFI